MVQRLTEWLNDLIKSAEEDEQFLVSWFKDTQDAPFSIVGGWLEGFAEDFSDILYISKSNPTYAMSVKIVVNEGPYAYTDFEMLDMPIDPKTNEVDDTCFTLEIGEETAEFALFLISEWGRFMEQKGIDVNDYCKRTSKSL